MRTFTDFVDPTIPHRCTHVRWSLLGKYLPCLTLLLESSTIYEPNITQPHNIRMQIFDKQRIAYYTAYNFLM